jgi:Clustered mitochondria
MDQTLPHSNLWMYGGDKGPNDEAAMKAASNELLGLSTYFSLGIKKLRYPLLAIIDYKGFRMIAVSVLPISKYVFVCFFVFCQPLARFLVVSQKSFEGDWHLS